MIQRLLGCVLIVMAAGPAFAVQEAGWQIQEEYEQLGHAGSVRTAATTPRGPTNPT